MTAISRIGSLVVIVATGGIACTSLPDAAQVLVLTNGVVYRGPDAATADTVAIAGDRIVYVGNAVAAPAYPGEVRTIDLGGRLLIPGLHDVHIHPLGIVSPGGCDLENEALSLAELVPVLRDCVAGGAAGESGWMIVSQWNFTSGNEPDWTYPTMRSALDAASETVPIVLLGNDGHHGAVNSATLRRARDARGREIGLSRETLAANFADYREYVGVDDAGQPNGMVNETARNLFGAPAYLMYEFPPVSLMPDIARKLAVNGITSVRDAAALMETLPLYDALYDSGEQTFRLTLAMFPTFDNYTGDGAMPDIDRIVEDFEAVRSRYLPHPLIKADTVKIFVDGVLEGDPLSRPPTLPNSAQLKPYLQPIFSSVDGDLGVAGYVDTDSDVCLVARGDMSRFDDPAAIRDFVARFGFYPSQCEVSNGVLEHPVAVIERYIQAFDTAGFTVHAHAIGDRAVRVAVNAFDQTRKNKDGSLYLPHGIAHAQLVHPDDIPRAGRLGLNIAFTYAWIIPLFDYDMTVVPFIDRVETDSLYDPANYSFRYSYPVASLQNAGVLLTAGSDAPVDTREPRPFENIEQAVTRANEAGAIFNPSERIDIHAALAAYTVNGARALSQPDTGTIAVGKKADLALLDRNIVELAEAGRAGEISDTAVLMTIFDGKVVYRFPAFETPDR